MFSSMKFSGEMLTSVTVWGGERGGGWLVLTSAYKTVDAHKQKYFKLFYYYYFYFLFYITKEKFESAKNSTVWN